LWSIPDIPPVPWNSQHFMNFYRLSTDSIRKVKLVGQSPTQY